MDEIAINQHVPPLVLLETLIALANTNGGVLRLSLPAESSTQHYLESIQQLLIACRPSLDSIEINLNDEIWFHVPRVAHLIAMPDGQVIGRFNQQNRQLNAIQIKKLMHERSVGDFDAEYTPDGLLVADVLCHEENPQQWLADAVMVIHRLVGAESVDTCRIDGNLCDQIDRGLEWLFEKRTGHLADVPFVVIEELLVNAIAHRNYRHRSPIEIEFSDQGFSIHSPGDLPGFATLDVVHTQHFHRNPAIVRFLIENQYMQGNGNGWSRIRTHLAEHGFAPARFVVSHQTRCTSTINPIATQGQTLLNWQQQRVLDYVQQHGSIAEHMLGILFENNLPPTLQQDLLKLVTSELLDIMNSSQGILYISKQ